MTTLSEMKTLADGYIQHGSIYHEHATTIIKQVPQAIGLIEKMAEALDAAQGMLPHHGKLNCMAHESISEALAEYRKLQEGK